MDAKNTINKILFITLSNIGDCILSLPALDELLRAYPQAEITVLCGKRPYGLFEDNFYLKRCIVYEGNKGFRHRLKIFLKLRNEVFDLFIDLKNSALPLLIRAKHKTYPWFNAPLDVVHMRQRHLYKVRKFTPHLLRDSNSLHKERAGFIPPLEPGRKGLYISDKDRKSIYDILSQEAGLQAEDKFIVIAPGARSHLKRWPDEKFAQLCLRLIEDFKLKIILVGDEDEVEICRAVKSKVQQPIADLSGKTTLKSLAALIEKAELVISNDSAVLHLASYLDRPTLAIFGPTDYKKYGPWSARCEVVFSNLGCSPCEAAQCKIEDTLTPPLHAGAGLKCMRGIKVEEVYAAAKRLL